MTNRLLHPYFISLIILLAAHFFTCYSVKVSPDGGKTGTFYCDVSLGKTGILGKVDVDIDIASSNKLFDSRDDERYGRRFDTEMKRVEKVVASFSDISLIPRFFRIYNVTIFILVVWGLFVFLAQFKQMRQTNKEYLLFGILGAAALQFFVYMFENNKVRTALITEVAKAKEQISFSFGLGFYFLIAGVLALVYSTFFYAEPKLVKRH